MGAFTPKFPRAGVDSIFGSKGIITELDYIQLVTTNSLRPYSEGQIQWDETNHTITIDLENNVRMQLGQELPVTCSNNTGATILNGKAVYISGFGTDHMTVALAKADALATSDSVLGVATQDILNNTDGYVTTFGFVRDVDTSAFVSGTALYLSATAAGGLTSTRPSYPNFAIRVGFCGRSHATTGSIWVTPQVFPDAQQIFLPTSGSPVDSNHILDWFRHASATGLVDDGDITDNGNTVAIAACDFYVREGTLEDDQMRVYRIAANPSIAVAANDVTYIYLDYNGGAPTWATGTSISDFNGIDKVIAYVVGRNAAIGQNNILDLRKINVDAHRKNRRQKVEFDGFVYKGFWRSSIANSVLGASGLALTVAAGKYFYFDNPITHSAFDTSVAGVLLPNVFSYFYNRTGTWTQITASKTINQTQYDVAGVLTTMTNNKFRTDWAFVVLDGATPYLAVILGNVEYASLALAQEDPIPTSLPPQFDGIGVLLGQIVIEKSAASVTIRQAGSATFGGGSVTTLPASAITFTPAGNIAATNVQAAINELDTEKQALTGKDASNGYAGLTLLKINFKNVLNTFTSFFTNSNTAARTYTFPDFDATMSTVAGTETLTNKTLTTPVLANPSFSGTTDNMGTVTTIDINGGTADGVVIGGASAAAGSFTTVNSSGDCTFGDASSDRHRINGTVALNIAASSSNSLYNFSNAILSGANQSGFVNEIIFSSSATTRGNTVIAEPKTQAASFTLATCVGYWARNATIGAGSAITNLVGLEVEDFTAAATNRFGIRLLGTAVASTNKWNIYSSGSAPWYLVGSLVQHQPAPTSETTTGTITAAEILTRIINASGTSYTLTLDTGANMETSIVTWPTNGAIDWSVINTASGTVTIAAAASGHTIVGTATILTGISAMFRTRKTATDTFITYRIA